MDRKLFRSGNSVVVAIPKEVMDFLGIADGDIVAIDLDREARQIIITPAQAENAMADVDEEFAHQVAEFIAEYRPALEELARR
jgi:putative addiction module antidote